MPTRFFVFLAAADRLCDALISTRPHDSNPDWGIAASQSTSALGQQATFQCVRLGAHTTVATGAMIEKVAAPIGRGLNADAQLHTA
jgi:hypothetical protein